MIRNSLKKLILITLTFTSILGVSACTSKQKELIISSNVKQDVKAKESHEFKLNKLKEFTLDSKSIVPVYWKDDENIIAIDDISTSITATMNIYNIDVKTSKTTIKDTLKDVVCNQYSVSTSENNKVFYIRDNKLWMYNLNNGAKSELYELSQIKKELDLVLSENKDALLKFVYYGMVEGSDKYLYIINQCNTNGKPGDYVRILDLETKKTLVSLPLNELSCSWQSGIKYSKSKGEFYAILGSSKSYENNYIYKFKPNNLNTIEKMYTLSNLGLESITDNGKELILSKSNSGNGSGRSILKYDLLNNKLEDIIKLIPSDNKTTGYTNMCLKTNNKLISYGELEIDSTMMKLTPFIGSHENNKPYNIQKLPTEQIDKYILVNYNLLFNKKCNMLLYQSIYSNIKPDPNTNICKYYVYKLNNK